MVALSLPISFPKFVTDKVVLQEIVYQTYIHGIGATLAKAKKATWPPLPLIVRAYRMVHAKDADKVLQGLNAFHFGIVKFMRNDSNKKGINHCLAVDIKWPYADELCAAE